ncbi:MAG: response regulator [Thermodesulfovibrionales bacterium]|nr:response regulator [Thermodesulfovibrionales bacterium]
MTIMVVDDDKTTRKILGLYLKAKGYDVVYAENGLEAMEKLGSENINLVMTDLNMPYMDGHELIRTIRADEHIKHIPILMVTTEADEEERAAAIAAGADGYLVKPVSADMVSSNIRNILNEIFGKGGSPDA